jgi:redox-sensitive bicupin YhaK (pirin superfamily)
MEITDSHHADVGGIAVRRALPRAGRRTVGGWCFVDHIGPATVHVGSGHDVAPHPHIGLQTVTWLFDGEALHRDSLGSEQLIRHGQLNLMTAGNGIAHAELAMGSRSGRLHGVQFWIAQPEATRHGPPAFEHHGLLPQFEMDNARGTVLIGCFDGAASPARRDAEHVGIDLTVEPGRTVVPLDAMFEHAVVVTRGDVVVDQRRVVPGQLAYLGLGRFDVVLEAAEPAQMIVFGGVPFTERLSMFWNFVARSHDEIDAAVTDWETGSDRFGPVATPLPRIAAPRPPWAR